MSLFANLRLRSQPASIDCATIMSTLAAASVEPDQRTYGSYERTVALRAVETTDFMTADWARLPLEFLARVATRIVNQVHGINRVVYDITSKPPGTIEWE